MSTAIPSARCEASPPCPKGVIRGVQKKSFEEEWPDELWHRRKSWQGALHADCGSRCPPEHMHHPPLGNEVSTIKTMNNLYSGPIRKRDRAQTSQFLRYSFPRINDHLTLRGASLFNRVKISIKSVRLTRGRGKFFYFPFVGNSASVAQA